MAETFEIIDRPVEVSCHSGFKYGERPQSFVFGSHRVQILGILERWYEETHGRKGSERRECFRVMADDGNIYLLSYSQGKDQWVLERIYYTT